MTQYADDESVHITDIVTGPSGPSKVTAHEGLFFSVMPELVAEHGLVVGRSYPLRLLVDLHARSECVAARAKALQFLARREHSAGQVRIKLAQRHFAASTIETVVAELVDRGWLDDERFARLWLDARIRSHPEGTGRLLLGLSQRGVDRHTAERAWRQLAADDEDLEQRVCRCAVDRLVRRRPGEAAERLKLRLAALGFDRRTIEAAIREGAGD